jgi:DNA-3-methyladenine glycosylase
VNKKPDQKHNSIEPPGSLLSQVFYARDALTVASELLGAFICHNEVVLRITEVEAYCWPNDTANHSRFGKTARNEAMWGPPGHAYVYICYGLHAMLNFVTNGTGEAAAVLIRSCEAIAGVDTIVARRQMPFTANILAGPGKVGQALALDKSYCHHALFARGGLEVREGPRPARILTGPRVGIDYSEEEHRLAPWRFAIADSASVTVRHSLR